MIWIRNLANAESHGRRCRADQRIEALEGAVEVLRDQRPYLLGLLIIGIIVAGRQRVGANHNAPFDLPAKAVLSCFLQGLPYIIGIPVGVAIFNAVVAGEVSAGLGRSNDIVGCDTVPGVRQRNIAHLRAQFAQ